MHYKEKHGDLLLTVIYGIRIANRRTGPFFLSNLSAHAKLELKPHASLVIQLKWHLDSDSCGNCRPLGRAVFLPPPAHSHILWQSSSCLQLQMLSLHGSGREKLCWFCVIRRYFCNATLPLSYHLSLDIRKNCFHRKGCQAPEQVAQGSGWVTISGGV